jgi:hypothetical protein
MWRYAWDQAAETAEDDDKDENEDDSVGKLC